MKVEKQVYLHIEMHVLDAEKLINLLDHLVSDSTMPDWAKAEANEYSRKLKKASES